MTLGAAAFMLATSSLATFVASPIKQLHPSRFGLHGNPWQAHQQNGSDPLHANGSRPVCHSPKASDSLPHLHDEFWNQTSTQITAMSSTINSLHDIFMGSTERESAEKPHIRYGSWDDPARPDLHMGQGR